MGEINNHANSVHLTDKFAPKRAHTMPFRLALSVRAIQNSSIRKLVVTIVSKCGVTNAEIIEQPQVRRLVSNLMESLNAERRDEFTLVEGCQGGPAINCL